MRYLGSAITCLALWLGAWAAVRAEPRPALVVELHGDIPFDRAELDTALLPRMGDAGAEAYSVSVQVRADTAGMLVRVGTRQRTVSLGERTGPGAARVVALVILDLLLSDGPSLPMPLSLPVFGHQSGMISTTAAQDVKPAVAPAPVTQAPFTQAPPTQAPASPVPMLPAPFTQAPATQAPASPVPKPPAPFTQAPATQAPASPVPIPPAPITQAPATQAPGTRAPSLVPAPLEGHAQRSQPARVVQRAAAGPAVPAATRRVPARGGSPVLVRVTGFGGSVLGGAGGAAMVAAGADVRLGLGRWRAGAGLAWVRLPTASYGLADIGLDGASLRLDAGRALGDVELTATAFAMPSRLRTKPVGVPRDDHDSLLYGGGAAVRVGSRFARSWLLVAAAGVDVFGRRLQVRTADDEVLMSTPWVTLSLSVGLSWDVVP